MYGIFTYIYPKNQPNVGKYAIHGASGIEHLLLHFSPVLENAATAEIRSPRCLQIGPPRRCVMQPKKSQPWAVELVGWRG